MRSLHTLLLPLCALLLASCAGPVSSPGSDNRVATLRSLGYTPLKLDKSSRDKRYSGRFHVNGTPVRFLIDSGANSTDLELDLALRAGIKPDDKMKVISRGALGRPVTSQVGMGTLTAGEVSASPFAFMLAPAPQRHTATSRYDGQMGLDALAGLGSLIDVQAGILWLPGQNAPNTTGGAVRPLGLRNGLGHDALPLGNAGRLPHLILESSWNGHRLTWVVDTGAEVTVLAQDAVRRHRIASRKTNTSIIDASGDHAPISVANLANVQFNSLVVTDFEVAVTDLSTVRKHFRDSRGRPIDGIIGMDFLTKSSALLDSASRLLYIGQPSISIGSQRRATPSPSPAHRAVAVPLTLRW
jgi:predicted aspartyl protease